MKANELVLYGSVGTDLFGDGYFTAASVREALAGMSGDITVRINSGGGVASEGQAIYTMLSDWSGKVTVIIDSIAASAASLIAMAGDEIVMRLGSWLLIHDPASPYTYGRGTEDDHLKEAEALRVISDAYADVYAARTGLSREEAREIMRNETVMDGQMAVSLGFATRVDTAEVAAPAARFDYRIYANAPRDLCEASKPFGRAMGQEAIMAMIAGQPRRTPEGKMTGKVVRMGAGLAAMLNDEIDAEVERRGDGATRADVIAAMASAAGIEPGTVDQILSGSINCPPLDRLDGFAEVLSASVDDMITAADGDGCTYESRPDASHPAASASTKPKAALADAAGRSRKAEGGPDMAAKKEPAAPGAADEELTTPEAVAETGVIAERARASRIMSMVRLARMDADFATDHITAGTSADAVLDLILAKQKETGDVDTPMHGRETARITRDETETRRMAMSEALTAQMRRRAPKTPAARPFMAMSLADIAAACVDHRAPLRTAGDRIEVFMAASHSRSDFPGIFENALNKSLLERYEVAEPTYRQISRSKMFRDFRVHPMVRAGDFPKMQPVAENGEIKFGTFGEKRETAVLSSYAIGLRISRQMMIDDDLGAIDDVVGDYGSMVADFEEETFYSFFASATLASDATAVFHASHNNLAGAGTAITVPALEAGRAAIRKQKTIDGKVMNVPPTILLVGPDKETQAEQLVTTITANDSVKVNPFSGRLQVVVSGQITGNTWYLLADPSRAGGSMFVHGFLDGSAAPRVRMDEPFGQQGMAWTVEHDFGVGAVDFRGGWKNPGA